MQGTLNSTEKTTQLLVSIVFKMYCLVFRLTEIIIRNCDKSNDMPSV